MKNFEKTKRNKVTRIPKRGAYDKATIYGILDVGFIGHAGFVVDGQPFVIPTAYGRVEDTLYIHGAATSRMLVNLKEGIPVCFTVTHLDALVLARSSYNHSMNYRSAVIFGRAKLVEGDEKRKALFVISENILKGRWNEAREPNAKEMKATSVLAIDIEQASAKIRTGPPGDFKEDYELPIWAGVVPIETTYGQAIPDEKNLDGLTKAASAAGVEGTLVNPKKEVEIISYSDEYKEDFKELNLAWIKKYFAVEPPDLVQLSNPKTYIIDKGGLIFFARYNGYIVGTVALIKEGDDAFELAKMAVTEEFQGKGIGKALLDECIQATKRLNTKELFLYSNRILTPAIKLYEKYGFAEVEMDGTDYDRANIKMVKRF